jgi:hypothetical protein
MATLLLHFCNSIRYLTCKCKAQIKRLIILLHIQEDLTSNLATVKTDSSTADVIKMFSATSLEWLLGFQEVKAPGSSRLSAL